MICKRGDVIVVLFPDSNQRTAKPRPALVIQADNLNTGLPQTIVAMITSNRARAGHPSRILIDLNTPQGQLTGLRADSVVMTDNIATILDSEIHRVIGSWPDLALVDASLRVTLAL